MRKSIIIVLACTLAILLSGAVWGVDSSFTRGEPIRWQWAGSLKSISLIEGSDCIDGIEVFTGAGSFVAFKDLACAVASLPAGTAVELLGYVERIRVPGASVTPVFVITSVSWFDAILGRQRHLSSK
jgi:hypothetical protein